MKKNEIVYEDYRKMIQKMSWVYARRSYIEFEEIEAQGNLIFMEARARYDPRRGASFSTYLYICLKKSLLSFVMNEQRVTGDERFAITSPIIDDEGVYEHIQISDTPSAERVLEFKQSVHQMTGLSVAIANMLFIDETQFGLTGYEHPRKARGVIAQKLFRQGESWSVIWDSFREIKTLLQEAY